jgi:hypothetical protein
LAPTVGSWLTPGGSRREIQRVLEPGERMLIPCDGGATMCRAVTFPPPLEIVVRDGIYVLVDDAAEPWNWTYQWVPDDPRG